MAYRRRQGITRASTFKEDHYNNESEEADVKRSSSFSTSSSSSLAAQAIRASFAYSNDPNSAADHQTQTHLRSNLSRESNFEDGSITSDSKSGFWGVLARKAKAILDEENVSDQYDTPARTTNSQLDSSAGTQFHQSYESSRKTENPRLRKGLDAITTSLNQLGDSFEKAFEEGRTIVENKTADIIHETRKLQIRRKGNGFEAQSQSPGANSSWQQSTQPQLHTNHETQLKASRDVRWQLCNRALRSM